MSRIQLALRVSDLEQSVAFYTTMFATEPAKRHQGYANFVVSDPPLKPVLIEGAPIEGGLTTWAWRLAPWTNWRYTMLAWKRPGSEGERWPRSCAATLAKGSSGPKAPMAMAGSTTSCWVTPRPLARYQAPPRTGAALWPKLTSRGRWFWAVDQARSSRRWPARTCPPGWIRGKRGWANADGPLAPLEKAHPSRRWRGHGGEAFVRRNTRASRYPL